MDEITTQELLDRILCADAEELSEIITAVENRFREVWPDWDILIVSSEGRTPEAHIKALQSCIRTISHFVKENDLP